MSNRKSSFVAGALLMAISIATVFGQTNRGFDSANMDKNTSACADFYQYANGTWLKNTEIPGAYSSWGSFNVLAENNRKTLHEILEEAAKKTNSIKGSNEQKIGDFYASCLDEAKREAEDKVKGDILRYQRLASQEREEKEAALRRIEKLTNEERGEFSEQQLILVLKEAFPDDKEIQAIKEQEGE